MIVRIVIPEEGRRALDRLINLPKTCVQYIGEAIDLQNELTVGHIQASRMSQRGPETLGVITNRLRSSLRPSKAEISGNAIVSAIGSNVVYMGPHEFGFDGPVNVRWHTRRLRSKDMFRVKGKLMSRLAAGKNLSKSAKPVSEGTAQVRAHTRHMRIPARAPIRRGIEDRLQKYGEAVARAIVAAAEGNP